MKTGLIITTALLMATAIAPLTHAAYPTSVAVKVEMWNDTEADLYLASASWLPRNTDLSNYVMPADLQTATFGITLNDPRNDSATFRMREGTRLCEFKLGHEKTFSWVGVNPAPDKYASATSVGATPAVCSASVIKGHTSLKAYTVRLKMQ